MTSKPRKSNRTAEAHIYLSADQKRALKRIAHEQCRSVNGQMLLYIQRGIEQDDPLHRPSPGIVTDKKIADQH